jgi:hypothetical protein
MLGYEPIVGLDEGLKKAVAVSLLVASWLDGDVRDMLSSVTLSDSAVVQGKRGKPEHGGSGQEGLGGPEDFGRGLRY